MTYQHTMNYLRVNTSDGFALSELSCSEGAGLLTPLSSTYEGRRDSLASSQCSLASSFTGSLSTDLPSTPRSQSFPGHEDFPVADAHMAFEDMSVDRKLQSDSRGSYHQTPVPIQIASDQCTSERTLRSDPGWHYWDQREYERGNGLRLSFHGHNGMMPASGDFTSALESSLSVQSSSKSLQSMVNAAPLPGAWPHPHSALPYGQINGLPAVPFQHVLSSNEGPAYHDWHQFPHESMTLGEAVPSTISPAETFVESDESYIMVDQPSDHVLASQGDFDDSFDAAHDSTPEHAGSEAADVSVKAEIGSPIQEYQFRSTHSLRRNRKKLEWGRSSTGGKMIKKERRSPRKRDTKTLTIPRELNGSLVETTVENGVLRKEDGSIEVKSSPESKKFLCRYNCGSTFARQEHLNRHERTHNGKKDYLCRVYLGPDEQNGKAKICGKEFNRNDNRGAHYLTHVERYKKGRNPCVHIDALCATVREHHEPQEAAKLIEKLRRKAAQEEQKAVAARKMQV